MSTRSKNNLTSKPVIIFEGPDGGGKSTLATALAKDLDARLVHFGPLPNVNKGLARMYVEAMLPALLGYQPVILDRCWLSEVPYGNAFRGGADRLGVAYRRMLERIALRCGAVVVKCQPTWEAVYTAWSRRAGEYLRKEEQLRQVYNAYQTLYNQTCLPIIRHDYTSTHGGHDMSDLIRLKHHIFANEPDEHLVSMATAGNYGADIMLVGESFTPPKDYDPLQQYPFVSFTHSGCSAWLARELEVHGIHESQLLWANVDDLLSQPIKARQLLSRRGRTVIALGATASKGLHEIGGHRHTVFHHPQAWKRFHHTEEYPLLRHLKGLLS